MALSWETVVAHALSLPSAVPGTHYGGPSVKANGHALIAPGREAGSFVLLIDQDTKQMLMETDPETYWQTPHYHGWPAVLVRYATLDPDRVFAMIGYAHAQAMRRKPKTARRTR